MRRALLLALVAAPALAADKGGIDDSLASRGSGVYERFCVSCHGERGDGKGYAGLWLDPKPRDFTRAVFKWRSTPTGTLPTTDDLLRTLRRGLHYTNMPSWEVIGDRNLRAVAEYVKTFSAAWRERGPGTPIQIPPETPDTDASRKRGAELYQSLGCFNCHGNQGRGDGPAAPELKDDWGNKTVPYDFTSGSHLKCGDRPEDLYRVFMTGLNGSPMPSFADSLTPADAWNLVHFLRTLGAH
jgi:mono/diheme cytochrome c family protein